MVIAGAEKQATASRYVLHLVPANGGGVDRYVRDICGLRARDCILHLVPEQAVFEVPADERLIAVDRAWLSEPGFKTALGRPALLHAHSTLAPVRDVVGTLCASLGVNYVLTLHDIAFSATSVELDQAERDARTAFVRKASVRIAPSAFIGARLADTMGPELPWQLVENGVENGVDAVVTVDTLAGEQGASAPFQVAVVGALGPHKGLGFLKDVLAALPPEIRIVIFGYADGQLSPGWLVDNRLWVHGAFEPDELVGLTRRFGARIALFPNRQPESYCYALSDAWCAGLPVLGPLAGAIGERIARTGAGWTYDPDASAEAVATQLLDCLQRADAHAPSVRAAALGLGSLRDMVARLNEIYENTMKLPDIPPQLRPLEAVAATHLNGQFFRRELRKLSGDSAFYETQVATVSQALHSLTGEYDGRGVWIATLEQNFAALQAELERVEAARKDEHAQAEAAWQNERAQLDAARQHDRAQSDAARAHEHAAHVQYAAKLQRDIDDTLAVAHRQERTIAIQQRALAMIPPVARRWMLARAERLERAKEPT